MDTRTNDQQVKVRDGAAVWRTIDDETVLLVLDSSLYLGLNETGTVLWPRMVTGTSKRELVDELTANFDIDADQAAHDVDRFIEMCREHELLEP